jgi:hypothetical protein
MNTLYEQNILEIQHQAEEQMLKLRERKFYTKNDIDDLKDAWLYRCVACGAICTIITAIVFHFIK